MVRVGGGWDEFEHFLSRHDPEKIGKVLLCKSCYSIYFIFFLILIPISQRVYCLSFWPKNRWVLISQFCKKILILAFIFAQNCLVKNLNLSKGLAFILAQKWMGQKISNFQRHSLYFGSKLAWSENLKFSKGIAFILAQTLPGSKIQIIERG